MSKDQKKSSWASVVTKKTDSKEEEAPVDRPKFGSLEPVKGNASGVTIMSVNMEKTKPFNKPYKNPSNPPSNVPPVFPPNGAFFYPPTYEYQYGYPGYTPPYIPPTNPNPPTPQPTPAITIRPPLQPTPRKAIKIVNPATKEEVKFQKDGPVPSNPNTPSKTDKKIILKNPTTGEVISANPSPKVETISKPVEPLSPPPVEQEKDVSQGLHLKEATKPLDDPESSTCIIIQDDEAEEVIDEDDQDIEEGEILEVRFLTSDDKITYPSFVPSAFSIKDKKYSIAFLKSFAKVQFKAIEGQVSSAEILGEGRKVRSAPMSRQSSSNRSKKGKGGVSMARTTSSGKGSSKGFNSRRSQPTPPNVEPLVKSENAWNPMKQKAELNETEAKIRQVKATLNKLTLDTFDRLSNTILHTGMSEPEILVGVIDLIFSKAIDEPAFGSMYASLCRFLTDQLPNVEEWIQATSSQNIFRRLIIKKCQEMFESDTKWNEENEKYLKAREEIMRNPEALSAEQKQQFAEEDYERAKVKRRFLGNIRFIGELFIAGLISEVIMHRCIAQLLNRVSTPEPEDVESLCNLMTTIGQKLDDSQNSKYMDAYFGRIKELSVDAKLQSRIRFMLMDLIDTRANKWEAKGVLAKNVLKTIAEIHKEDKKQKLEEEKSRRGSRRKAPSKKKDESDGWNTVSNQSPNLKKVDLKPTKILKNSPAASVDGNKSPTLEMSVENKFSLLESSSKTLDVNAQKDVLATIVDQVKNQEEFSVDELVDIEDKKSIESFVVDIVELVIAKDGENAHYVSEVLKTLFRGTEDSDPYFDDEELMSGFLNCLANQADDNANDIETWIAIGRFLGTAVVEELINEEEFEELVLYLNKFRSRSPLAPQVLGSALQVIQVPLHVEIPYSGAGLERFWPDDQATFSTLLKWLSKYSLHLLTLVHETLLALRESYKLDTFETGPMFRLMQSSNPDEAKVLEKPEFLPDLVKNLLGRVVNEAGSDIEVYKSQKKKLTALQPLITGQLSLTEKNRLDIIFAIEAFVQSQSNLPKRFMENIFRIWYESDLLTITAFKDYQKSEATEERKKLLQSLDGWFTYLNSQ